MSIAAAPNGAMHETLARDCRGLIRVHAESTAAEGTSLLSRSCHGARGPRPVDRNGLRRLHTPVNTGAED